MAPRQQYPSSCGVALTTCSLLLLLCGLMGRLSNAAGLVETCRCGGSPTDLCTINDIVTTTRGDPTKPSGQWHYVTVMNNCMRCNAGWVAVQSEIPGYPSLIKNGAQLRPWETIRVGPRPGPTVHYAPTQVNFTCIA